VTLTADITLSATANGKLTLPSGSSATLTGAGTTASPYVLTGTQTSLQAAIRSLIFTPTKNQVAVGSTETTTFTVKVSAPANTSGSTVSATNSTTSVIAKAVDDAPTALHATIASGLQAKIPSGKTVPVVATGTAIATLAAVDSSIGDTYTYTLATTGAGSTNYADFKISGTSLEANVSTGLLVGTYDVLVEVTDSHGGTFLQALQIVISATSGGSSVTLVA
jgi:hypothetical protein